MEEDIVYYPIIMIGKFIRELRSLANYVNVRYDGDCLNVLYIPNKMFWESATYCFNPRNTMMISKNDGRFNNQLNHYKDILITATGIINLARDNYTQEQLDKIEAIKRKHAV